MRFRRTNLSVCAFLLVGSMSAAQERTERTDNINLFQTYFQDATITDLVTGEGFFQYGTYDFADVIDVAAQVSIPVAPLFQVSGQVAFESVSPDAGEGESGITDIGASGRYQVLQGLTPIAVGGFITLPIGSEKIGQGNFNFGFFGSLRHHPASSPLVITGTFGLEFFETVTGRVARINPITGAIEFETTKGRDTSVLIGAGVLYPLQSGVSLVGEFNLRTEGDYALLSGGLDYALSNGGRFRAALGLGLDDGAPDFALRLGYGMGF